MYHNPSKKVFEITVEPYNKIFYLNHWKAKTKRLGFPEQFVEKEEPKEPNLWVDFTESTSIHGVRYLSKKSLSYSERLFWWILLTVAVSSVTYVSVLVSKKFQGVPLSTVFEDTNYASTNINFPTITICNNNKINFSKSDEAIKKFAPNLKENEKVLFLELLKSLQNLVLGSFEELSTVSSYDLTSLSHINLTELQIYMAPDCNKFLITCWWIKQFYNCCDIFSFQLGIRGVCYSFNSHVNAGSKLFDKTSKEPPERTMKHGEWGGMKLWVDALPGMRITRNFSAPGIYTSIHDPFEWPSTTYSKFVPIGSQMCFVMEPIIYSTSDDVGNVDYLQRQCLYVHEVKQYKVKTLDNLPYTEDNCMVKCIQEHMLNFCGCVVHWMIPIRGQVECNATGLMCMEKFNVAFKNLKFYVPDLKSITNDSVSCNCLPECQRVDYRFYSELCYDLDESESASAKNIIQLDIHYRYNTMTKFRTDLVFGILDLIVSFGGIAGLFLGCSLLSLVEVIYFLSTTLYSPLKKLISKKKKRIMNWID